jgi:hypothetical protein
LKAGLFVRTSHIDNDWALAKETGKFEKLLRYPGEDGDYETARMDKIGL